MEINGLISTKDILEKCYPIGAIYISVNNTNPKDLFGFGEWEEWGKGRTIVGVDSSQTEFSTVEKSSGSKTVALSLSELPMHSHSISPHSHNLPYGTWGFPSNQSVAHFETGGALSGTGSKYPYMEDTIENYYFGTTNNSATLTTSTAGASIGHNNLQPYITCYMFKRIS